MNPLTQLVYLKEDLKRWKTTSIKDLFYMIFEQAIWATVIYRLSRAIYCINVPILKILLRLIGYIFYKFSEIILGVGIPPATDIGPGLYIGHAGLVMINSEVRIGKNLSIGPGVLIGTRGGGHEGAPVLGDQVYVGVGAKILGKVTVGNNVKIGANSVVVTDVPDNVAVFGVPAKIIGPVFRKKKGS